MQKAIFIMLLVIAFLLGANLYKDGNSHAAKFYQYRVVGVPNNRETLDKALNEYSVGGWEFVCPAVIGPYFIFRK